MQTEAPRLLGQCVCPSAAWEGWKLLCKGGWEHPRCFTDGETEAPPLTQSTSKPLSVRWATLAAAGDPAVPCRWLHAGLLEPEGSRGSHQCGAGGQVSLQGDLVDVPRGWTLGHASTPPPGDLSKSCFIPLLCCLCRALKWLRGKRAARPGHQLRLEPGLKIPSKNSSFCFQTHIKGHRPAASEAHAALLMKNTQTNPKHLWYLPQTLHPIPSLPAFSWILTLSPLGPTSPRLPGQP